MIKQVLQTVMVVLMLLPVLSACQNEQVDMEREETVPEGYVAIRFGVEIPGMTEVQTRSVDPDGGGIQNMTLFCFDAYGLFISTAKADLEKEPGDFSVSGKLKAAVPHNTRIIHFVANQNMSNFPEDNFRNKPEAAAMATLEGSSGKMIYWGRFASTNNDQTIDKELSGKTITLVRNQAEVTINNPIGKGWLEVTGFVTYNTPAFGTVAPYDAEKKSFDWPGDRAYVTLPVNDARLSDIMDVSTSESEYVFECENSQENPVSVIIRGYEPGSGEEKYYRVMLVDENGDQLMIRRNYSYRLNIVGKLSYGQNTFAEAVKAAATNNVWVSVSDEVASVQDNTYRLSVEKTGVVIGGDFTDPAYTLYYKLERLDGNPLTEEDKPEVSWLDGNNVAGQNPGNLFSTEGNSSIVIQLLPMGEAEKREGTLLVKKGRLQRKIKVVMVKTQRFEPTWVSTEVMGQAGQHVTLMFTVPESCPEELFPMDVLIGVGELDVRSASGMDLPVITDTDPDFGEPNEWGYKYKHRVEAPGVQRIYFKTSLNQSEDAHDVVKIEAPFFESLEKTFTFTAVNRAISVAGLESYSGGQVGLAEDEMVYYRLVPQKKNARVEFTIELKEQDKPFMAGMYDKFLLYSQNLDHYTDEEVNSLGIKKACTFEPVREDLWDSGGRVYQFKPDEPGKSEYKIYLQTNRPHSEEVVRIASNQPGNSDNYQGNTYRSMTFELANYNPFRFAARINDSGTDASGTTAESVDEVKMEYGPNQRVDIEFDVTSFQGTDKKSVDPFGNSFEIYIDAPMLEIDEERLAECKLTDGKLKKDPDVEGRFIYMVDADREKERSYGTDEVVHKDATSGVNQSGEHKTLPFKTATAVSGGDVVISSDKEMVVFFDKTFRIVNQVISGTIQYEENGVNQPIPVRSFVSFERKLDGSRIGSMTITADGKYELRLRKEYRFNWDADEIELHYTHEGKVYHCSVLSLAILMGNPDLVLVPAVE